MRNFNTEPLSSDDIGEMFMIESDGYNISFPAVDERRYTTLTRTLKLNSIDAEGFHFSGAYGGSKDYVADKNGNILDSDNIKEFKEPEEYTLVIDLLLAKNDYGKELTYGLSGMCGHDIFKHRLILTHNEVTGKLLVEVSTEGVDNGQR